ncbi:T-box protein H15 isoform X2 [Ceratitis capitata]|uniref:T-box protein H15 isoform X2 n=1 Tax=Ceratitis capitata TaxID=7213 RepID=UPI0006189040|nr:T-box protein H15 isoform X2 [Ceratitis capitata]
MLLRNTPTETQQLQQKQQEPTAPPALPQTHLKQQKKSVHQQLVHSQQEIQNYNINNNINNSNNNNNNNNYYLNDKPNLNYLPANAPHHLTSTTTILATTTTPPTPTTATAAAVAAAAAAATLLLNQSGVFATTTKTTATAARRAAAAAAAVATTNIISNSNSCAGATDFSIAAIMARGAANASSREPSERSLSPVSVEPYPEPDDDVDVDVDVDVVDCSDSESPSVRPLRLHYRQQLQQQQHQQQQQQHLSIAHQHKVQRHHHQQHTHTHNQQGSISAGAGSGGQQQSSRSSSRGRTSPQSPASVNANEEDRLSPEPAQSAPKIVGSCNCDELLPVQCHLETKELWDKFHELGTEMIITKTGRRMFPTVRVSFSGPLRQIQPPDRYAVVLDVVPMDSRRYRYAYHRSSWLVAGKADPPPPARLYPHPDCPISVEALRKQVVSFEKVKLTNNEMDKNGQIVLNSMHRYQPRIHLVRLAHGQNIPTNPKDLQELDHKTYVFPETVFTAVTAYQNQLITKLKIDSNPFAKGFRDSSRLTDFDRDPMDSFLLEQHLRSPLRFFPDPLMAQLSPQEADAASLAFIEKARQHLQLFGRTPYTEMLLPQLYQRPPVLNAFNLGMWQQQWPQLTAGFIASANQQAAAAQAAAAAAAAANACRTPPPPPPPSIMVGVAPPPPATTPSSSGSASPDMRLRHFQRYSPYQVPQQQLQQTPLTRTPPPL